MAVRQAADDESESRRCRAAYQDDDNLVFCSPHRGSHVNPKRYAETFRAAPAKAEIMGYVRPLHDGRHSRHTQTAGYLEPVHTGEWNPSDYAVNLTRRARGLPFWFSLAVHGTRA